MYSCFVKYKSHTHTHTHKLVPVTFTTTLLWGDALEQGTTATYQFEGHISVRLRLINYFLQISSNWKDKEHILTDLSFSAHYRNEASADLWEGLQQKGLIPHIRWSDTAGVNKHVLGP